LIVSVLNNKGGTGKTTTAVNLAAATALEGKKVLLIDLDPQGNATTGVGFEKATLGSTIYNVLAQTRKIQETILGTKFDNLSLLPSNLDLASAEVELSSTPGREYILREALAPIKQDYDNIIIDCPPNIGLLTLNALVTSDLVLIPVQCEFYPMEGLPTLIKVMDLVKSRLKAQFDFRIVLTMYDAKTTVSSLEQFRRESTQDGHSKISPHGRSTQQRTPRRHIQTKEPGLRTLQSTHKRTVQSPTRSRSIDQPTATSRPPHPFFTLFSQKHPLRTRGNRFLIMRDSRRL